MMAAWTVVCLVSAVSTPADAQTKPGTGPVSVRGVTVTATKRQRPTDAPPPLEAYAAPAFFDLLVLSPDGSQVASVVTQDGVRSLVTQRLADNTTRMVRLPGAPVSSIAWADQDHVLVANGASTLRGTCEANDQRTVAMNVMSQQATFQNLAMTMGQANPRAAASIMASLQAAAAANAAMSRAHPCVYYGVREKTIVTSVDMASKTGSDIGGRFGDYASRPLGTPIRVSFDGQSALMGPFMEMRLDAQPGGPAEPIFLWSVDPKTTGGRLINDGGGLGRQVSYVDDWLVDRSGAAVARSLYDFSNGRFVIQMKLGGVWKPVLTRPIQPKTHTFAPFLVGLGANEGSIVILDAAKDEVGGADRVFHYYALSADGAVSGPLEPDDAARDRPVLNPASGRIAGFLRTGVDQSYVLTDPGLQSLFEHALDAAPGKTVRIVSIADDPRKMVIHAEGRDDPGSYVFIDFGQGTSIPLGEDYAQIPSAWLATQKSFSYKASDGLQIDALLTEPPGAPAAGPLPLVVLPHDGPQAHDRLGFDWLAQALASRGYLVLQPQYRGSDGDGLSLMEAGYGQLGRKMQSDLADGVRSLVSQGLADPGRVCIVGAGLGGYAALMGAAEPGTYRCAASINGVSDLKTYQAALRAQLVQPDQDQITTLVADLKRSRAFAANPDSPDILASYMGAAAPSPVDLAATIAVPVLLVHEIGDKTAPVQQSRAMREALAAAGKSADLVEVTGPSDHALKTKAARLAVLQAVLGFLAKNDPAG